MHTLCMKTWCGAEIWVVTTTLLICTSALHAESTLNVESQHTNSFAWSYLTLRKVIASVRPAQPERHIAYKHNETCAPYNCKVLVPSDPRMQRQLCTAGVSTYASSLLHESAVPGHSQPVAHKELWPLSNTDTWAFGLAAVAIFIAAGGGIGGGGILVPLYASILG